MCSKVVDNYPHALEVVSESCKSQKMCDQTVSTYLSTMTFPECLMTQDIGNKAVIRCFLNLILFLINIKLKKCVIGVSENPF